MPLRHRASMRAECQKSWSWIPPQECLALKTAVLYSWKGLFIRIMSNLLNMLGTERKGRGTVPRPKVQIPAIFLS
jgi:hypothetical protein